MGRMKEIIKNRDEINEMETKRINETELTLWKDKQNWETSSQTN
jgi:hypothetical protein